ncbi:Exosome component 5 [Kappamyces sp. JEL0829]|nr:Exosome component 5 [Kappamyces sp. JEL0829]
MLKITLQVLAQDGSLLATAINAMVVALLDAGVALKSTCTAVTCMVHKNGNVLLDPSMLEMEESISTHTFAFDAITGKCLVVQSNGVFSQEEFDSCYALSAAACKSVYAFIKESFTKKIKRLHDLLD